jgi:hypothetical protein
MKKLFKKIFSRKTYYPTQERLAKIVQYCEGIWKGKYIHVELNATQFYGDTGIQYRLYIEGVCSEYFDTFDGFILGLKYQKEKNDLILEAK